MAGNVKRFYTTYTHSATLTVAVQRLSDGYYLQSSDGSFGASISYLSMTESMVGGYSLNESRFTWNNDTYDVVFYAGGVAIINAGYEIQLVSDQMMTGNATASLASRNAVSQIAAGLTSIQSILASQAKQLSILSTQVNAFQTVQRSLPSGSPGGQ